MQSRASATLRMANAASVPYQQSRPVHLFSAVISAYGAACSVHLTGTTESMLLCAKIPLVPSKESEEKKTPIMQSWQAFVRVAPWLCVAEFAPCATLPLAAPVFWLSLKASALQSIDSLLNRIALLYRPPFVLPSLTPRHPSIPRHLSLHVYS